MNVWWWRWVLTVFVTNHGKSIFVKMFSWSLAKCLSGNVVPWQQRNWFLVCTWKLADLQIQCSCSFFLFFLFSCFLFAVLEFWCRRCLKESLHSRIINVRFPEWPLWWLYFSKIWRRYEVSRERIQQKQRFTKKSVKSYVLNNTFIVWRNFFVWLKKKQKHTHFEGKRTSTWRTETEVHVLSCTRSETYPLSVFCSSWDNERYKFTIQTEDVSVRLER